MSITTQEPRQRIGAAQAAGIAGFGFVASYLLVWLVLQRSLPDNATVAQIRAHLVDDRNLISLGALFTGVAGLAFLGFVIGLADVVRRADPNRRIASTAVLAGGVLWVAMTWAAGTADIGLAYRAGKLVDVPTYLVAQDTVNWYIFYAFGAAAFVVGATTLVARRTGLLPVWLVRFGYFVTAGCVLFQLATPIFLFTFPLWVIAVSVIMVKDQAGSMGEAV